MKKILILGALFTVISVSVQAQTRSYIGLFGGASIPTGQFSNKDYGTLYNENNKAGYAKTGPVFGLDGAYYFHKNIAIGGLISYQDQGQLSKADVENLSAGYTDAFAVGESTVTSSERYSNLTALLGPQYSFMFDKLTVDVRLEAGLIKSFKTPELKIVLEDPQDPAQTFYQRSSKSTAFAYGASAGLRYALGPHFDVGVKGNFVHSEGFEVKNENRRVTAGRLVTKQPVSYVQTTLGLNYNF